MKRGKLILVVALAAALLGGGAVLVSRNNAQTTPQSQEEVKVEDTPVLEIFTGKVEVKLPNEDFSEGVEGQKIPVGTTIRTDDKGRAQIKYPNNSVTRIDHKSEIVLDTFENSPSQTNVTITVGRIWNRIAKLLGKDDEFSSSTDTLVASVRGTSYGHGILSDGNNKVSVSRSVVDVECNSSNANVNVTVNKQITTKCTSTLATKTWGNEENNDEWFKWNADQDKKLDDEFGLSTYDDLPSPTPTATPKATPKPTVKGTSTTAPSATPTATPTVTATATPTTIPTATPGFTITDVSITCSNNAGRNQTPPPCGSESGYALAMVVRGTGFNESQNPEVKLIKQSGPGENQLNTSDISIDGDAYVRFQSTSTGIYEVHYIQNNQDVKYSQTISLP